MALWRVWNKIRVLWELLLMIYILFYLPSSGMSEFVLYWQDGQCVCVSWLLQSPLLWEVAVGAFPADLGSSFRGLAVRLAELLQGSGAVLALAPGEQGWSVVGYSPVVSYPAQPDFSSFLC